MNKNHLYKDSLTHIILRMLENEGEMYGYEIAQRAKQWANCDMDIGEEVRYPALSKLEAQGFLQSEMRNRGHHSRKYYQIKPKGGKYAKSKITKLSEYIQNRLRFMKPQWQN